jgi:hypothetical protein
VTYEYNSVDNKLLQGMAHKPAPPLSSGVMLLERMKKSVVIAYFIILLALTPASVITTYAWNTFDMFVLDTIVSFLIAAGAYLYIRGRTYAAWKGVFLLAILGESFLLFTDTRMSFHDILMWLVVLTPAFVMNAKVAGITMLLQGTVQKPRAPEQRR